MGSVTITDFTSFRKEWPAPAILTLLSASRGWLLLNWAVGVGKSFCIDDIIDHVASGASDYDLVIALFPRNAIIDERRIVATPVPGVKTVRLKARPINQCASLDPDWRSYEKQGLGMLGREELCGQCSKLDNCLWPDQYSRGNLAGAKIVLGTQTHLAINPNFVDTIADKVGAKKVLLLIDEDQMAKTSFKRVVDVADLRRFHNIVSDLDDDDGDYIVGQWVYLLSSLVSSDCCTLHQQWSAPYLPANLRKEIELTGVKRFGSSFRNISYDLESFTRSPVESRETLLDGSLQFAVVPEVNAGVIIFSATAHLDLLNYRLGVPFDNPFQDYKFRHLDTRWYNLASGIGFSSRFKKNSKQIFDFFAELIIKRIAEGKRVLLVSKKKFKTFCVDGLKARFEQQGIDINFICDNLTSSAIAPINVIPVIHYNVIGINLFTNFDCVFCLNGYYARPDVLSNYLQEMHSSDFQSNIEIQSIGGLPRRRTAFAHGERNKYTDANRLAHGALMELEMGVVVQTVGRCRPFTKPREIITFQCSDNPWHKYTHEFNNLEEMREYFGISSSRKSQKSENIRKVLAAHDRGLTAKEIVEETNLSKSSVYEYLKVQNE